MRFKMRAAMLATVVVLAAACAHSGNRSDGNNKGLKVGDSVPDLVLKAHDGTNFELKKHRGKKVLLSSFPKAFTPV